MGQRQQQCKRKQVQEQVKDYALNLQGDAGLILTSLQMQTTTGEKVDVKLYAEIPTEDEPLKEDKTNEMAYVVVKNRILMECYHEFYAIPKHATVIQGKISRLHTC